MQLKLENARTFIHTATEYHNLLQSLKGNCFGKRPVLFKSSQTSHWTPASPHTVLLQWHIYQIFPHHRPSHFTLCLQVRGIKNRRLLLYK